MKIIRKEIIKSPWTISFSTAIFSLLLTMGYDYLKQNPILTTVSAILKYLWGILMKILNIELKIWWILVAIIIFVGFKYLINKFKKGFDFKPDFYTYTEGKFKRWKWTWAWEWNTSRNGWIISNMKAHCPNCDTPMIDNSSMYGLNFDCPRCDFRARDYLCDEPEIILDNIERMRKKAPNT